MHEFNHRILLLCVLNVLAVAKTPRNDDEDGFDGHPVPQREKSTMAAIHPQNDNRHRREGLRGNK